MKDNLHEKVCFWSKGDLMQLANEHELYESEKDFLNFTYCLSFDELCDFVVFLFCGDWSRNITIIEEEAQKDKRVIKLFDYVCERFKD